METDKWSKSEKAVARRACQAACNREVTGIVDEVVKSTVVLPYLRKQPTDGMLVRYIDLEVLVVFQLPVWLRAAAADDSVPLAHVVLGEESADASPRAGNQSAFRPHGIQRVSG